MAENKDPNRKLESPQQPDPLATMPPSMGHDGGDSYDNGEHDEYLASKMIKPGAPAKPGKDKVEEREDKSGEAQ